MADKDSKLCGKYSRKRQNKSQERWTEGQRGLAGYNKSEKVWTAGRVRAQEEKRENEKKSLWQKDAY